MFMADKFFWADAIADQIVNRKEEEGVCLCFGDYSVGAGSYWEFS